MVKLLASISLSTVKSFEIVTLALGTITSPVPFARSSKFALLVVVVIKLSSISISSNCAYCVTSSFPVTVKLPSTLESPVCVKLPTWVSVPVIFVSCSVVVPSTVKLLLICTLLSGTNISPVPLARNSKSALLVVVVMKFVSIVISSITALLTFMLFQRFEAVPKLYVLVALGTISLSMPATI